MVKISVSDIRVTAFSEFSDIMRTRNFTIFTVYGSMFGHFINLCEFFMFSNYIGEIDQFTLDLLERSDT